MGIDQHRNVLYIVRNSVKILHRAAEFSNSCPVESESLKSSDCDAQRKPVTESEKYSGSIWPRGA